MRGSKAKQIRREVRDLVGAKSDTQYEVVEHPAKMRINPITEKAESYNPRQLAVVSAFRLMAQSIKKQVRAGIRDVVLSSSRGSLQLSA